MRYVFKITNIAIISIAILREGRDKTAVILDKQFCGKLQCRVIQIIYWKCSVYAYLVHIVPLPSTPLHRSPYPQLPLSPEGGCGGNFQMTSSLQKNGEGNIMKQMHYHSKPVSLCVSFTLLSLSLSISVSVSVSLLFPFAFLNVFLYLCWFR